jgi:hypothetical protein
METTKIRDFEPPENYIPVNGLMKFIAFCAILPKDMPYSFSVLYNQLKTVFKFKSEFHFIEEICYQFSLDNCIYHYYIDSETYQMVQDEIMSVIELKEIYYWYLDNDCVEQLKLSFKPFKPVRDTVFVSDFNTDLQALVDNFITDSLDALPHLMEGIQETLCDKMSEFITANLGKK